MPLTSVLLFVIDCYRNRTSSMERWNLKDHYSMIWSASATTSAAQEEDTTQPTASNLSSTQRPIDQRMVRLRRQQRDKTKQQRRCSLLKRLHPLLSKTRMNPMMILVASSIYLTYHITYIIIYKSILNHYYIIFGLVAKQFSLHPTRDVGQLVVDTWNCQ